MAKEMKHLHLFPTEFPSAQITILVGIIRDPSGHSKRDRLEAAWWVAGYGLSIIPDEHPMTSTEAAPTTDEELATMLEGAAEEGDAGMRALPWALLLPLILRLVERWMK